MSLRILSLFVLVFTHSTTYSQVPLYVPTDGLVSWWQFNGGANDESGNGNHGVPIGDPSFMSPGRTLIKGGGNSYYGTGTSSVRLEQQRLFPTGNQARTVSLWFKSINPKLKEHQQLFSYGNNILGGRFGVFLANNKLGVEFVNSSVTIPFKHDDKWHNIIVMYPENSSGSQSVKIYLDGKEKNTSIENPLNALNTRGEMSNDIGALFAGQNQLYNFVGYIDDIGLWNRSLSDDEIQSVFKSEARDLSGLKVKLFIRSVDSTIYLAEEYNEDNTYSALDGNNIHSIEIGGVGDDLTIDILATQNWSDEPTVNIYHLEKVSLKSKHIINSTNAVFDSENYLLIIKKNGKIIHKGTITFYPAG
jgi:hypothetical protein